MKSKDSIIDSIINEINLRADELNEKINSIYFGGGTPSLISENDTKKILYAINKKFHISEKAEVTMECNPDDINIKNIITIDFSFFISIKFHARGIYS